MESFVQHQFINSRSLQYTYYASPPVNNTVEGPTLLLLHGFPDQAMVWSAVVASLLHLGLRILVPDLLGYAGTSKPWDPSYFNSKVMADDLAEILYRENITNIIPVGHDWGSFLAHRFYLFHPERVSAIAISAYPLNPIFRTPVDIDQLAAERERKLGYPLGAYYKFFGGPEAARLFSGHPESFFAAGYGEDDAMKQTFGYPGAMREWLVGDKRRTLQSWARDPAITETAVARFQGTFFESPIMWYRAFVENYHHEVEKDLPEEVDRVNVPFMHIAGAQDWIGPAQLYDYPEMRALFTDLTTKVLNSSHFLPTEVPHEFAGSIIEWLDSKNLTAKFG